ncbi:MAG: FAD-dependent monooxygenase [Nitratireductor sp.]
MNQSRHIVIAGGGIAGLASALYLEKNGYFVSVFDKAKTFEPIGAGIQLSPNAMHVLADLGLERQIANMSVAPDGIDIRELSTGDFLNNVPLGKSIQNFYGAPYLSTQRSDLHTVLLSACKIKPDIAIHTNHQIEDITSHLNGASLITRNGTKLETHSANAAILADGIKSSLRQKVLNPAPASFSGFVAWRAMLPMQIVPDFIDKERVHLCLGRNKHILLYPVSSGRYLNIVVILKNKKAVQEVQFYADPAPMKKTLRFISRELLDLLNLQTKWSVWPIFEAPVLKKWHEGNIIAVGDSAHGLLPFSAQGAAMALEDASELGHALATHSTNESAFKSFENKRMTRVNKMRKLARSNGDMYHMGFPASTARNMVISYSQPGKLLDKQKWIYDWKPPKGDDEV